MARIAAALIVVLPLFAACRQELALPRQTRKAALVDAMRDALQGSVEAEKSAVLAITDEESKTFADESRRRAAELSRLRNELEGLITPDGRPGEVQRLAALDTALGELRDVDERLLALAVANTNLKAAWLAAGDSARALDRLVDAVAAVEADVADAPLLRDLSAASVAALRIQATLAPHIAAAEPAEMQRIEDLMRTRGETVDRGVVAARERAGPAAQAHVAEAGAAWADYQKLVAEVLRLSRLNTNVHSVDVSLHEKRRVTAACLDALTALLAEIRAGASPTR